MVPQVAIPCSHITTGSTVSYDAVFFVRLQHRQQLQPCTCFKVYAPQCTSLWRPKGASGPTDEDFVLLSLRAGLSQGVTHKTPYGGVPEGGGGGGC